MFQVQEYILTRRKKDARAAEGNDKYCYCLRIAKWVSCFCTSRFASVLMAGWRRTKLCLRKEGNRFKQVLLLFLETRGSKIPLLWSKYQASFGSLNENSGGSGATFPDFFFLQANWTDINETWHKHSWLGVELMEYSALVDLLLCILPGNRFLMDRFCKDFFASAN